MLLTPTPLEEIIPPRITLLADERISALLLRNTARPNGLLCEHMGWGISLLNDVRALSLDTQLRRCAGQLMSELALPRDGTGVHLLDLGCGLEGSQMARAIEAETADATAYWLDRERTRLGELGKPEDRKICACASATGFEAHSFHVLILGSVKLSGLERTVYSLESQAEPTGFEIAREAVRILQPGGILLVNFASEFLHVSETLRTAEAAGFSTVSHVARIIWSEIAMEDWYAFRTPR